MKKIAIIVFSLMFTGVPHIGAQYLEMNFDGKKAVQNDQGMEKFSMPEAFADIEYDIPVPTKEVNYKPNKKTSSNCRECKLDATKLQNLRKKILIKSGLLKDEKALRFIENEKTIIFYTDKNIFFSNKLGGDKYNVIWQSSNKQLVDHLINKERQIIQINSINKGRMKVCGDKLILLGFLIEGVMSWIEVWDYVCEWVDVPDNDAEQEDEMVDGLLF